MFDFLPSFLGPRYGKLFMFVTLVASYLPAMYETCKELIYEKFGPGEIRFHHITPTRYLSYL